MKLLATICLMSTLVIGVYGLDWFGSQNKYKCRCSGSMCKSDGQCMTGSKCQDGWFGPSCQYQDLVTTAAMTLTPTRDKSKLTDRDDTTCVKNRQMIQIDWNIEYPFTWLRVVLNDQDFLKAITLEFSTVSTRGNNLPCVGQNVSNVNNRTKDIFCFLNTTIKKINISWNEPVSVCSFYVSGGRNVALKQQTWQSSSYFDWAQSDVAVDGDTTSYFESGSCTHTGAGDKAPSWEVSFSTLVSINRFLLYNRADFRGNLYGDSERLRDFTLQCFNVDGTPVCTPPRDPITKLIYNVVKLVNEPVSFVRITAGNNRNFYLTLCEVEIFGDSVCNATYYGLECNSRCNCKDKSESCFVATGGCPSGCAPGYYEEGCKTECPDGSWGSDCLSLCNDTCFNNSCNKKNGECDKKCDGYSDPPNCQTACDASHYGVNCSHNCPVNCDSDGCESKSGACRGCRPGHHGAACDKICEIGTFGQNCSQKCSNACLQNGENSWCGHVDGRCLHGCNASYNLQDLDECAFRKLQIIILPHGLAHSQCSANLIFYKMFHRRRNHKEIQRKPNDFKHLEKDENL